MIVDKLAIINDALLQTGNNTVTVEDGSDEWVAASAFYDRVLRETLAKHNWKFATKIADLVRVGASNYPGFADIFERPQNCLQVMNVWDTAYAGMVQPSDLPGMRPGGNRAPAFDYKIIGGTIHCTAPNGAQAYYLLTPDQPGDWPVGFVEAVTHGIASLIANSINEDTALSGMAKKESMLALQDARARSDQEEPRRVPFRSRLLEARRHNRRGA